MSYREEELKTAISSAEKDGRRTVWVFVLIGAAVGLASQFELIDPIGPVQGMILGILCAVAFILNQLKVLMHKAEYREWMREFAPERWKRINDD
ncbi:MAG: hypothetical protein ABJ360_22560 [Roseobacter sp.]